MFRRITAIAVLATVTATFADRPAAAITAPSGFTDTLVASMELPTAIAALPDGRKLVAERTGNIRVLTAANALVSAPAISLPDICTQSERGLLGIAVDPANAASVFTYSTSVVGSVCVNRVSRMTLTGSTIDPASVQVLVDIPSPRGNHNAGDIEFGKDGLLYITTGDGAADSAESRRLNTLNGKVLRITPAGGIPAGNPYQGAGTARCNTASVSAGTICQEIYAYGLRNPFRMANDMNSSGSRFFINDVGDGTWEEVDELAAGADYGWDAREGFCARGSVTDCGNPGGGVSNPVHAYGHDDGCRSITGGAFVPTAWPNFEGGSYLFADFVCNRIYRLVPAAGGGFTRQVFIDNVGSPVHLEMVQEGGIWSMYYLIYDNGGEVRKLTPDQTLPTPTTGRFNPITPTRVADTRSGLGLRAGRTAPLSPLTFVPPASVVPAGATAVAVNVTVTSAAGPGFVSIYPGGTTWPGTSNLNVSSVNEVVANAAIVRPGIGGAMSVLAESAMHVIVDVTGYWTSSAQSKGGRFVPLVPSRLLDTRNGTGGVLGRRTAGTTVSMQVGGREGVPSSGVAAVAIVVTVSEPTTDGFVTVWPSGASRPVASTLNPAFANDIRSNLALVPLGSDGKVSLFTSQPTQLIADVVGYFTDESAASSASGLFVAASGRVFDSRFAPDRPSLTVGSSRTVAMTGAPSNATAAAFNLTATNTASAGYLTAYPVTGPVPVASNVNFDAARRTRAALAFTAVGGTPKSVRVFSVTGADAIVDVAGWFTGA